MDIPQLEMYYDYQRIVPLPNVSYSTELKYKNDTVVGMTYNITLKGTLLVNGCIADDLMTTVNNIFNSNGKMLVIQANYGSGFVPIFLANNVLVRSISFEQSNNSWATTIPYTIVLSSMNVAVGADITAEYGWMEGGFHGFKNTEMINNLQSPYMVDMLNYSIQDWSENFSIQTGDNQLAATTVVEKLIPYGSNPASIGPTIVTTLGGGYFNITYTVNAVGKQDMRNTSGTVLVLPAWEHAKRFCHTKVQQQMGSLFQNFLSQNGLITREWLGFNGTAGAFSSIADFHSLGNAALPSYGIYNENFSFETSETGGSFSITYNAIVKKHCPTEVVGGNLNDPGVYLCSDNVIHEVTKSVSHTYNATDGEASGAGCGPADNLTPFCIADRTTEITINGNIKGLVPGGGLFPGGMFTGNSQARLQINNLRTGSLLVYNTYNGQPPLQGLGGGTDRSYWAGLAFDRIYDYNNTDLTAEYKALLNISPAAMGVSPTAILRPSSMNVTRDLIGGSIQYSATYSTSFNCDPNNFEIKISSKDPLPLMAEFVIPNNNYEEIRGIDGQVCPNARGYDVVQLLGTFSPRTLDVSISADVSADYNKCCLGTDGNWNLMEYDFVTLGNFIIPPGMNIPYISDSYALTKKTSSVTYPKGSMSIDLSYICADMCEIHSYFTDVPH